MAKNYDPTNSLFGSMQKVTKQPVETPVNNKTEEKKKPVKEPVIEKIEETPAPAKEEKIVLKSSGKINLPTKETRSEHKSFLITKNIAKKLSVASKKYEISENALVNAILEQALEDL